MFIKSLAGYNAQKWTGFTGFGAKSSDHVVINFALDSFFCRDAMKREEGGYYQRSLKVFYR